MWIVFRFKADLRLHTDKWRWNASTTFLCAHYVSISYWAVFKVFLQSPEQLETRLPETSCPCIDYKITLITWGNFTHGTAAYRILQGIFHHWLYTVECLSLCYTEMLSIHCFRNIVNTYFCSGFPWRSIPHLIISEFLFFFVFNVVYVGFQ